MGSLLVLDTDKLPPIITSIITIEMIIEVIILLMVISSIILFIAYQYYDYRSEKKLEEEKKKNPEKFSLCGQCGELFNIKEYYCPKCHYRKR